MKNTESIESIRFLKYVIDDLITHLKNRKINLINQKQNETNQMYINKIVTIEKTNNIIRINESIQGDISRKGVYLPLLLYAAPKQIITDEVIIIDELIEFLKDENRIVYDIETADESNINDFLNGFTSRIIRKFIDSNHKTNLVEKTHLN